jgi:WD40 repeat protein
LTGHTAAVNSVAWARDGIHIATGSNDMTVGLWPLDTAHNDAATPVFLSGHQDVVRSVSFSSVSYSDESNYLVSGSADHTVSIWSVQDTHSARLATYTGHKDEVCSVDAYPQQPTIARLKVVSGSEDTTAHVWSWDTSTKQFRTLVIYRGHHAPVTVYPGRLMPA